MPGKVVTQEEWVVARKELLIKEKEVTRTADALSAQIRELPMVKVEKKYIFEGQAGKTCLGELFQGRKQLLIYHFMFALDSDQGCPSCSFLADHIPDLRHLASRNTSFAVVSRAPYTKIEAFQKRMGWDFPWCSSFGNDFNYDFHVTQDETIAPIEYNFRDKAMLQERGFEYAMKGEQPGISAFYREDENIFHTFSSYSRGLDKFLGTYVMLDITHLGRQDDGKPGVKFSYHDQYD